MDGASARQEPFKSDPGKQRRYAQFCLALEGKASATEALKDTGGLSEAARVAELAEFGRVYRCFRQANPEADIQKALDTKDEVTMAPVLRRTVRAWVPDDLLCKRWGVPKPKPPSGWDELPGAKRQREYAEQVQAGLSKAVAGSGTAPHVPPASLPGAVPSARFSPPTVPVSAPIVAVGPAGDPPRPPKSLFAAIFGDGASDDDT
mmetsp:Transcript_46954/g.130776  ORF Transcript_46954/g.130776 Transcript_46954/m.130776 type:complete len:205 (-) Transcript_46954:24-638(-)